MQTFGLIIIVVGLMAMTYCFFMIIRNKHVLEWQLKASHAVYLYNVDLIYKCIASGEEYDGAQSIDSDTATFEYGKHLNNLRLWGKFSAITPEYHEKLDKYITD